MVFQSVDVLESYRSSVDALKSGFPINEDIGDWLLKKVRDARSNTVADLDDSQFFNVRKNVFKQIMKGNYHKALGKMERYNIKYNSASPSGVKIFRHRFEKLPFVLGAIGYTVYNLNQKRIDAICDTIFTILTEVFGDNIDGCLKMKSEETPKYNDLLSFCLTWGAKIPPEADEEYSKDDDSAVLDLVKSLIELGWTPGDMMTSVRGFVRFVARMDFILTTKYLHENGFVKITPSMVRIFGLDEESQVAKYMHERGEHPFKLHEPDVVLNKKGNIASDTEGTFAAKMSALGYSITSKDVQTISYGTMMAIQDELAIVISRYAKQNGEKFSNLKKIDIFKNSNFGNAKIETKKLIGQFGDIVSSNEWVSADDNAKAVVLGNAAQKLSQCVYALQYSMNLALTEIGLPQVVLGFSTDISNGITAENVTPIMKELGARISAPATTPQPQTANSGAAPSDVAATQAQSSASSLEQSAAANDGAASATQQTAATATAPSADGNATTTTAEGDVATDNNATAAASASQSTAAEAPSEEERSNGAAQTA